MYTVEELYVSNMMQVEGCERQVGKCRMDSDSLSCGPYQIKEEFWIDCGSPGESM